LRGRVREGGRSPYLEGLQNCQLDGSLLGQHHVGPESEDSKTAASEPRVSDNVISLLLSMLASIDLNNETSFQANKIHDADSKGMLATKPVALELLSPEPLPEPTLCVS
jgi:hypothetical protein